MALGNDTSGHEGRKLHPFEIVAEATRLGVPASRLLAYVIQDRPGPK